ncbi:hypothetical protein [Amycolatopsis pigmentata]|uniref:Uncharacterized protein n=1 Tax=Amycolatopsis pigmentata TaxID=450801 RepID=A0ABW5FKV2_9PSEU
MSWSRRLFVFGVALLLGVFATVTPSALSPNSIPAYAVPPAPNTNTAGATVTANVLGTQLRFYYQLDGNPIDAWNSTPVPGPGAYSRPAIARDGSATVIAAKGPDNSLYFYWNLHGSPTWNYAEVAGPGTILSAPSIVRDSTRTMIAATTLAGDVAVYTNLHGSPAWTAEFLATTYAQGVPSLVRDGTTTALAFRGVADSLYFSWRWNSGSTWTQTLVDFAGSTASDPSLVRDGTSSALVTRSPSNALRYYRNLHGTPNWIMTQLHDPGYLAANSEPQLADDGTTSAMIVQRANGSLDYFYRLNSGNYAWSFLELEWPNVAHSPSLSRDTSATRIVAPSDDGTHLRFYRSFHGRPWAVGAFPVS